MTQRRFEIKLAAISAFSRFFVTCFVVYALATNSRTSSVEKSVFTNWRKFKWWNRHQLSIVKFAMKNKFIDFVTITFRLFEVVYAAVITSSVLFVANFHMWTVSARRFTMFTIIAILTYYKEDWSCFIGYDQ